MHVNKLSKESDMHIIIFFILLKDIFMLYLPVICCRRVAGLNNSTATEIIKAREKNGPFTNRQQLLKIKGINAKVFKQCAGFLRVKPINMNEATFYKQKDTNKLDSTNIHPESYEAAQELLKHVNLKINHIGTQDFINRITTEINPNNIDKIRSDLNIPKETVQLILESLSKPLNHDLRTARSNVPISRRTDEDINVLEAGTILKGRVEKITDFGNFVDVGMKMMGLIHPALCYRREFSVGDKVEVEVRSVEMEAQWIALKHLEVLPK